MPKLLAGRIRSLTGDGLRLGLAVSGGGDSMALLHMCMAAGISAKVVTVNHGLRPEAGTEAAWVGQVCAGLGVAHTVLHWHWDGTGNVQDAARRGRRALIADWARGAGIDAVALAHTEDDVAETFFMRLARVSGLEGLSRMADVWEEGGIRWVRPMLDFHRSKLREWLKGRGLIWVDDPSNDNDQFERVRIRKALAMMEPLGVTGPRIAEVARNLAKAQSALNWSTAVVGQKVLRPIANAIEMDAELLSAMDPEMRRQIFLAVIRRLGPTDYDPRGWSLLGVIDTVGQLKGATIAGCRFHWSKGRLLAFREFKAVADISAKPGEVWDKTWIIQGPAPPGAEVRPLGQGVAQCKDWALSGLPRVALSSSPALWLGDALIAAPLAGFGVGYSVKPLFPAAALHHSTGTH